MLHDSYKILKATGNNQNVLARSAKWLYSSKFDWLVRKINSKVFVM